MNINIDYQSRVPIYEQIVKEVERLSILGLLPPGSQIPSIRELACKIGINPNTVKKAYDLLEQKKIIISKSTKGTFIADNITRAKEEKIKELTTELNQKITELKKLGLTTKEIIEIIKLVN